MEERLAGGIEEELKWKDAGFSNRSHNFRLSVTGFSGNSFRLGDRFSGKRISCRE